MATIVDALLITLGLEVSNFQKSSKTVEAGFKKTRDDADRTAKQLQAQGKKAGEFFGKIRDGILGVTAAALGASGVKSFVEQTTASGFAVGQLARNLGMGTEALSVWEGVIRRLGGSTEEADGMLRNVNNILQEIKLNGSSAAITPLVRAGLNLDKFRDSATSAIERQMMIADAVKKLSPQDAQSFFQQSGFTEGQISRLMAGRQEIERLIESQRKYNALTPEMVANDRARLQAWRDVSELITGIANKILDGLSPYIQGALGLFKELLEYASAHIPETTILVGALGLALAGLATIKIAGLVSAIGALTGGLGFAGAAATGLLGLLGKLGLIGGTVAAGIFAVKKVNELWNAGNDLYDINHRQGASLTPEAQARVAAAAGGGAPAAGGRLPRGIRNNNPGNLNFVGQPGATREAGSGRFAAFNSMEEGVAALASQLQRYGSRGIDTIAGIISKYAPSSENNTGAYIGSLARRLGVSPGDHLDLKNVGVLRKLIGGIGTVENGPGRLRMNQINAGLDLYQSRRAGGGNTNSSKTDVKVNTLNVNTSATDAKGIARTIGTELGNLSFAQQANYSFN